MPLSITGKKPGATHVVVKLKGGLSGYLNLDWQFIKVLVPGLFSSVETVTIPKGSKKTVTFKYSNCPTNVMYQAKTTNKSAYGFRWGKWSGTSNKLTIDGKKAGSGRINVILKNSKTGAIYAQKQIAVYIQNPPKISLSKTNMMIRKGEKEQVKLSCSNCRERVYVLR